MEIRPGDYRPRSLWDEGNLGYDERGRELPLPKEARLVIRWFGGGVLIVAKGSIWNGIAATYDGRHDRMTPAEVREAIQGCLDNRPTVR